MTNRRRNRNSMESGKPFEMPDSGSPFGSAFEVEENEKKSKWRPAAVDVVSLKNFDEIKDEPGGETTQVNLDDILINELGQFGTFQARNIALVAFVVVTTAVFGDFVFTAADVPHRCKIPECGEVRKNETFTPEWLHNAVPHSASGFSSCERFAPLLLNGSLDSCPAALFDQTSTVPCDGYVYGQYNSVVYDFDLGCQDWMRVLYGTLVSVGAFISFPIGGLLSDRFGRRFLLVIGGLNTAIFGVARAFAINYPMALAIQLLWSMLGATTYTAAYIFATELVGPKYRVVTSAASSSLFASGELILGASAWLIRPWRHLALALCTPCFLIVMYHWLVPESVRWLLSKHRYEEARKILEEVAKVNKKEMSPNTIKALTNPPTRQNKVTETRNEQGLVSKIAANPVMLRRVMTTPVWWVATIFVYYGLSINSVGLSTATHLNYILTCLVEIPGYFTAAFLLNTIGRRTTLFCGFLLTAVCNFTFTFVSQEMHAVRMVSFLLGKFSISGVMTSLYLFTSELYPTEYRHSLFAFSSTIGRIGSLMAPLTPVLVEYWYGLPTVLFGGAGLVASALVLTQPETLGTKLPDTIPEAAALGRSEL